MMKKLIGVLLCLAIILMLPLAAIHSNATTETDENLISPAYIMGDLDNNQKITAVDARICLRASAGLIELTEEQGQAADVFNDGEIKAINARKILRVSARLEKFEISIKVGQSYVLPPLKDVGIYQWSYSLSPSTGLDATEKSFIPSDTPGDLAEKTYTFLALIPGTYTVNLDLIASGETRPLNNISFVINVEYDKPIELQLGESFELPPLKSAVSGMYQWSYSLSPSTGLSVTEQTLTPSDAAPGTPIEKIYTFLAEVPGTYTVNLKLSATSTPSPSREFSFTVIVPDA